MKENLLEVCGLKTYFRQEDRIFKAVDGVDSVSYTHLDVYKRQVFVHGHQRRLHGSGQPVLGCG